MMYLRPGNLEKDFIVKRKRLIYLIPEHLIQAMWTPVFW